LPEGNGAAVATCCNVAKITEPGHRLAASNAHIMSHPVFDIAAVLFLARPGLSRVGAYDRLTFSETISGPTLLRPQVSLFRCCNHTLAISLSEIKHSTIF
jgi:hypothetical protein